MKKIVPLQDYILGLDPEESKKGSNMRVIKEAIRHVIDGKPLGIFPAGEVSSYQADSNHVEDKEGFFRVEVGEDGESAGYSDLF
ncbi:MAG: hypothetical protein ACLTZT_18110 [Butyricimonas faecalis]